ncbi:polymorphic toxin type 23 domain-containing protein [Chryseobacterium lacus]|uniref:polymorphic toxin type 23 domain-containing protein n=1 Tax=Chryseobacterium lacus TaxID=2058346 RepID=UPI000F86D715|nr:polymorphic toxin type 23 domain-containing protein [Chryseobacterium lacus]RST25858.1 hypothetical protein EIZ46_10740 [Chryseobacterium lacus]
MGAIGGMVSGFLNPGMFAASGYTFGSHYASGVISSVLPPFDFNIGSFNFSISPSIAIGKGWGFGANVSATFHAGDFAMSAGMGIMNYGAHAGSGQAGWEYRKSAMLSYDDGKFGLSTGTNFWTGLHVQQTGIVKIRHGDFALSYENDGKPFSGNLGDGGDSYRTAAASISIGDFSVGISLFTGLRDQDSYDNWENNGEWDGRKGEIGNPVYKNGIYYKNGLVYEKGNQSERYRLGAAYFSYKNYRIGIDSDRHVRHTIQNRWIHNSNFAGQRAFEVIDFSTKPYFQYRTSNIFTSW